MPLEISGGPGLIAANWPGVMVELTDRLAEGMRAVAEQVRPAMPTGVGLFDALDAEVRDVGRRAGLEARLEIEGPEPPPDAGISYPIFCAVREALGNAARHAEARSVLVHLVSSPDRLSIEVKDDGRGIRQAEIAGARSFGLLGMREHVAQVGGTTEVTGRAGEGTVVRMVVPLAAEWRQG